MNLFGLLPQGAMKAVANPVIPEPAPVEYSPTPIGIPGLLGIKGKGRDILGQIGDALLVANGGEPQYAMAKKQQAITGAMQDFASNPIDAIKRVAQIDPEAAQELLKNYQEAELEKRKVAAQERTAESSVRKTSYDIREKGLGLIGNIASGVNEATLPAIKERLISISKDADLGIEDLISNAKTVADLQSIASYAITADQKADNARADKYNEERLADYDAAESRQRSETVSRQAERKDKAVDRKRRTDAYVYKTTQPVAKKTTSTGKPKRKVFRNGKIVEI